MNETIKSALILELLRTLELDPTLSIVDATERVIKNIEGTDFLTENTDAVRELYKQISVRLRQRGVLNPIWLADTYDLQFQFFLVDSRSGGLKMLVRMLESLKKRASRFILYGEWDSLVIFSGSVKEAEKFLKDIEELDFRFVHFAAREAPLLYRYQVFGDYARQESYETQVISDVVEDYHAYRTQAEELQSSKIILGPVWDYLDDHLLGIHAYVGIRFRGGGSRFNSTRLLEEFFRNTALRASLLHLYETVGGQPFHYFAKLVCKNMEELDEVTDAISFLRINQIALETTTFIIAGGREPFLTLPSDDPITLRPGPDFSDLPEMAYNLLSDLGEGSVDHFNSLDLQTRLVIINSLIELDQSHKDRAWDDERERGIANAIENFKHSSLAGTTTVHLEGPINQITKVVEGYLFHVLRLIADRALNGDYARAQIEFKLNSRDFRELTFGPAISSLRTIRKHEKCDFIASELTEEWLKRLDAFAAKRNAWSHYREHRQRSNAEFIQEAAGILIEGIAIISWFGSTLVPILVGPSIDLGLNLQLQEPRTQRGVFISYSTKDNEFAERIRMGLVAAFRYEVWMSETSFIVGDNMLEEINKQLARNDIYIILLSENSVKSKWVQHELYTVLINQLNGRDVEILPLLIEKCDIPSPLINRFYIDMTHGFEEGFLKLLEHLKVKERR